MKDTGIVKEVDDRIMRDYTNNQYYSAKEIITRYKEPEELMKKISEGLGLNHPERLKAKYIKEASKDRAFTSYVLRVLCGFSYKQICHFIGNMSMSGITRLVSEGFNLITGDARYKSAFNSMIGSR